MRALERIANTSYFTKVTWHCWAVAEHLPLLFLSHKEYQPACWNQIISCLDVELQEGNAFGSSKSWVGYCLSFRHTKSELFMESWWFCSSGANNKTHFTHAALFRGWKLFCNGLGTSKPVTRQPNRVMSIHVPCLQAVLRLTVKWVISLQSEWCSDVFTLSQTPKVRVCGWPGM